MHQTNPIPSIERAIFTSHSLSEIIKRLDEDIETLVGAIPLQQNDAVDVFTRLIREDIGSVGVKDLLKSDPDELEHHLQQQLGSTLPLCTVMETHDYRDVFEVKLKDNFGLVTKYGKPVDFTMPNFSDRHIASIITQLDDDKKIDARPHQDHSVLTINFYSAGKGVQYDVNGQKITFQSPCITLHRGTAHKHHEKGAVMHTGQPNIGQQATNIVFVVRNRPSNMLQL